MCRLVEGCKLGCFSEILAISLQECPTETLFVDICIRIHNIIPWLTGCIFSAKRHIRADFSQVLILYQETLKNSKVAIQLSVVEKFTKLSA